MKRLIFTLSIVCALIFMGCTSVPKDIPTELTSAQLIQLGQSCYAKADYDGALTYFKTDIQRYGMDNSIYVEAKYEMGHTYMAQKKYEPAYKAFTEIKTLYDSVSYGALPPEYKKLAEIELAKIPEKEMEKITGAASEE